MKDAAAQVREQLLILRCQAGDREALADLMARFSPGLRMYLGKITGPRASPDDLLQETWIDVYCKINRLKRCEAFTVWLYRIARDKAYRALRQRPSQEEYGVDLGIAAADDEPSFTAEDAAEVRAMLDELPIEQREALVLRFVEGLSY